jgi:hypothetical protein
MTEAACPMQAEGVRAARTLSPQATAADDAGKAAAKAGCKAENRFRLFAVTIRRQID